MDDGILSPEQIRLAIVGAGPIGLEAALYARFLGYATQVLEQAPDLAPSDWPDAQQLMPCPFGEACSALGLAAIEAQGDGEDVPSDDDRVSWLEYRRRYLQPLARTDLLIDSLQLGQRVTSLRPASEAEIAAAESRWASTPSNQGQGQEQEQDPEQEQSAGYEEELDLQHASASPLAVAPELREWNAVPWRVESVDAAGQSTVRWFDWVIDASGAGRGQWWRGTDHGAPDPDWSWYGSLAITIDAQLRAVPLLVACGLTHDQEVRWSEAAVRMPGGGGAGLGLGEPGLFVLGGKSYGCTPHFQLADGYAQIRDLFAWLGGRDQLDLYRTVRR